MIAPIQLKSRPRSFQAIFIALLLHAAVFNLFVFNFQRNQILDPPLLVFLGSILQRNDIANAGAAPQLTESRIVDDMMATMQSKLQSSTGRLTAIPANTTSKPALSVKPIGGPKQNVKHKSEFLSDEPGPMTPSPTASPAISPHQPLKLDTP